MCTRREPCIPGYPGNFTLGPQCLGDKAGVSPDIRGNWRDALGKRGADDLAELDEAITGAYVAGLRAEGDQTPLEVVRRGHAVCMLIFSGFSALPVELLEAPDSPELRALLASRAAMATYSLDLLESTEKLQE